MALFQKSVLQKHLKSQDQSKIADAYEKLKAYQAKAAHISEYNEEEYQDGFLRDVFVNVLGYTYKYDGNDTYNLLREKKNVSDSKKADGAILKNQEVFCVIELKDTSTKDLAKVETQAFGYQSGHVDCNYVIISNFEKLNFYIKNKLDKAGFNLFTCTAEQFQELWICLQADNLLANLPLKVKEESILAEENITKQLYKDYSAFKTEVWQDIVKNCPEKDQLLLFRKSQKLLDRFLFIFFAEDGGLLPPNSISRMVERFDTLEEEDAYKPLYDIFKQYFGYINKGRKGKTTVDDIFEYNGGLFLDDSVLDNIKIDDELLKRHVLKLTAYDFQSDVDVNILGHIFENSLNEIENVSAMLEGEEIDKSKSKRKKDGVFYTPKYITKYIVDNTIGKLCEEKKAELNIIDEEYAKGRRNRKKEIVKQLDDNLKTYRDWLLGITICDPACGSGAFLNQALEFLITEHAYIDELYAQLMGASIVFQDVSNHILEKNIFGVDINEESVDIAKLSLWLRTAQRGRKLTTLSNNLKCGNSLIDDPAVAGDKAFNWQQEFPQVFANGGFDVVIGNPPYGASFNDIEKKYFKNVYSEIHVRTPESFNYFIYRIITLINVNGSMGLIIPSSFLNQFEFEKCRKYLINNSYINRIINLGDDIFQDVSAPTCIIVFSKEQTVKSYYSDLQNEIRKNIPTLINDKNQYVDASDLNNNEGSSFIVKQNRTLIEKCFNNKSIEDIVEDVATGISPGLGDAFVKTQIQIEHNNLEKSLLRKLIIGGEINRYYLAPTSTKHVIYATSKTNIEDFPNIYKELSKYKEKLEKRVETASGRIPWFVMLRPRREKLFVKDKILIRQTADRILACFDKDQWHCLKSGIIIQLGDNSNINYNYLLALLNSKLMDFLYQDLVGEGSRVFPEVKPVQLFKLPIVDAQVDKQKPIIDKVAEINSLYSEYNSKIISFFNLISSKYQENSLQKKLHKWHELEFGEFIKELKKSKVQLSLSEEAEWMQYFNEQKQKAQELKAEIDKTDKEIDEMVYELYGLTKEEIKIVEGIE